MLEAILAENRALKVREAAMQQRLLLLQRQAEEADALRTRQADLELREQALLYREGSLEARERDLEARLLELELRESALREVVAPAPPRPAAASTKAPRRRAT
ncbi:MAG TPA: hypothetical protein PKW90_13635, partial [Myxococcota bacterium]|nr:hypothetical protein [Myxococcota bacterium]